MYTILKRDSESFAPKVAATRLTDKVSRLAINLTGLKRLNKMLVANSLDTKQLLKQEGKSVLLTQEGNTLKRLKNFLVRYTAIGGTKSAYYQYTTEEKIGDTIYGGKEYLEGTIGSVRNVYLQKKYKLTISKNGGTTRNFVTELVTGVLCVLSVIVKHPTMGTKNA